MEIRINKWLALESVALVVVGIVTKAVSYFNGHYSLGAYNLISGNFQLREVKILSLAELLAFVVAMALLFVVSRNELFTRVVEVILGLVALGLICYCAVAVWNGGRILEQRHLDLERKVIEDKKTIVIGGGTVTMSDGTEYNNTVCRESIENCIENGNSIIEIDLYKTIDNKLVCTRLNPEYPDYLLGMPVLAETMSESEFLNSRIYGEFTPISLDGVVELMRENSDLRVVTDIQTDICEAAEIIALAYPDCLDRFYFQIYQIDEYKPVRTMGFRNIIFNMDRLDYEDRNYKVISEFVKDNDLLGVAYWESWIGFYPTLHEVIKSLNVSIYVHPVDEYDIAMADYGSGVAAFFTNNIDLREHLR